jgi:hypothetical protein
MKKIALAALATGLVLALSGCYKSKGLLFDLGQAVHPFADGTWIGDDEDHTRITIATYGDAYLMSEGESTNDVVLVPLPGHPDTYAAAESDEGCGSHPADCEWEYAVVVKDGDKFREIGANCEKDWPAISKFVASRNDSGDECMFDSADGLMQALSWVADNGQSAISYSPEP